ncbi:MAG: hypothetical protein IPL26_21855 [Leptospiraceae bacterium]|nr:hypothetical protein [Leptospiraceae bacterium]
MIMILRIKKWRVYMIRGSQNEMSKEVFALILHTLQEADLDESVESTEGLDTKSNPFDQKVWNDIVET